MKKNEKITIVLVVVIMLALMSKPFGIILETPTITEGEDAVIGYGHTEAVVPGGYENWAAAVYFDGGFKCCTEYLGMETESCVIEKPSLGEHSVDVYSAGYNSGTLDVSGACDSTYGLGSLEGVAWVKANDDPINPFTFSERHGTFYVLPQTTTSTTSTAPTTSTTTIGTTTSTVQTTTSTTTTIIYCIPEDYTCRFDAWLQELVANIRNWFCQNVGWWC